MKLAGIGLGAAAGPMEVPEQPSDTGVRKFYDFASWLKRAGDVQVRQEAREVKAFDPDLIELRSMSLANKIRIQRERNYRRLLENKKAWFDRMIAGHGFVENWF